MSKLLVFCIDALCAYDVEKMRKMPHFGPYMEKCALVKKIEPVWPALTYCCHTSILTGCYVDRHGVENNEKMKRGGYWNLPWYGKKEDVKVPTLLDRARERGLTTCSLSWPVSGGADYDMNMPMIVPYGYEGWDPEPYLEGMATKNLMERYFYKHGRYIKGPGRSLDLLTMSLALDILEDYEQPNVLLREAGFIRVKEDGRLDSFDAVIHSTGLGAYVELYDPQDLVMKERVRTYLESLKEDPRVKLAYVMDKEEAKRVCGRAV